jgi:thiopeptide-type bacteriocin biosynthesis protein
MLLDDFGYALPGKLRLLEGLQQLFFREFGHQSEARLRHALNDKYRLEAPAIAEILNPDRDAAALLPAVACFTRRSERNRSLVPRLQSALGPGKYYEVVPSFIHMALNRLFVAKPRMHELVVYHFLSKYYKSQLARSVQGVRQAPAVSP